MENWLRKPVIHGLQNQSVLRKFLFKNWFIWRGWERQREQKAVFIYWFTPKRLQQSWLSWGQVRCQNSTRTSHRSGPGSSIWAILTGFPGTLQELDQKWRSHIRAPTGWQCGWWQSNLLHVSGPYFKAFKNTKAHYNLTFNKESWMGMRDVMKPSWPWAIRAVL